MVAMAMASRSSTCALTAGYGKPRGIEAVVFNVHRIEERELPGTGGHGVMHGNGERGVSWMSAANSLSL